MSTTQKYNGWKNYQTWNVALWFGNDEGLYRAYIEAREQQKFNAKRAQKFVEELLPDGTPDLKDRTRPYAGVDWSAISRSFNEV